MKKLIAEIKGVGMNHSNLWKYCPHKNCRLPFNELNSLEYCWGWAGLVDKVGRKEAVRSHKKELCYKGGKCEYFRG